MIKFKKYFPYIILFAALSISGAAAYYSIYGLSRLFAGASKEVIVMAAALEFGKLVIATGLKLYWGEIEAKLKYYLLAAMVILIVLTSSGIYGFLSDAYKQTADKDLAVQAKVGLMQKKKERFEVQLTDYKQERDELNQSTSKLRQSLATDNQYQTVVKGQIITQIQSTSKKGVQSQLELTNQQGMELGQKIDRINDSIGKYDLAILDFQSRENISELGPLKYLSTLTGKPMDNIINWFLIMIMVVFDPLAIALVLLALFAFGQITAQPPKKISGKVGRPRKVPIVPAIPDPIPIIEEPKPEKIRKPHKKKESKVQEAKKFDIEVPDLDSKPLSNEEQLQTPSEIKTPQNTNDAEINILDEKQEIPSGLEIPVQIEKPAKVRPRQPRQNKVVDTSLNSNVADHLKGTLEENKKKV